MEDNRFLDWIRRDLGIRVTYDWIYSKDEFQRNIDLYIACDMLPDAFWWKKSSIARCWNMICCSR